MTELIIFDRYRLTGWTATLAFIGIIWGVGFVVLGSLIWAFS